MRLTVCVLPLLIAGLAACTSPAGSAAAGTGTAADAAAVADSGKAAATTDTIAGTGGDALVTDSVTGTKDSAAPSDTAGDAASGADAVSADAVADASTTDTGPSKPVAIEQLQEAFANAYCTAMANCGGAFFSFSSTAGCKAFLSGSGVDGPFDDLTAAVKTGKIKYSPEAAGKCVAAIASTCAILTSNKQLAVCKAVFVGTLADKAACDIDEVCVNGWCERPDSVDSSCPGTCALPKPAGGACQLDDGCADTLVCIEGKCAANGGGKPDDPCIDTSCGAGLYCSLSSDIKSVCVAQSGEGGKCNPDALSCKAGLFCQPGGNFPQCTKQIAIGQPCKFQNNFGSGSSGEVAPACVGGVCVAKQGGAAGEGLCVTPAKLGQPCVAAGQCIGLDTMCADLKDAKGTCTLLPTKGAACTVPNPLIGQFFGCILPYICDETAKKCVDPPSAGQPCSTTCAPGVDCNEGMCYAKAKIGESCGLADCVKGASCVNAKCAAVICTGE